MSSVGTNFKKRWRDLAEQHWQQLWWRRWRRRLRSEQTDCKRVAYWGQAGHVATASDCITGEDDTSLNPVNDHGASSSNSDSSSIDEDSQVEIEGKTPCTCTGTRLPNVNTPCMLLIWSC